MTYEEASAILDQCTHVGQSTDQRHADCEITHPDGQKSMVCCECYNAYAHAWQQARREQLAALPRCAVPRCNRRGATRTMGVLLCNAHWHNVERAHNRRMETMGGIGLFLAVTYPPAEVLVMAVSK